MSIFTLGVEDLEASVRFYRDGLGLPLRPGNEGVVAFFELRGTWLALYPRADLAADARVSSEGAGFPRFTIAHNVRTKPEVDQLLEHVTRIGGRIQKPAHDTDWGGYSGYFQDPDGFLWEVAWNPHFWIE